MINDSPLDDSGMQKLAQLTSLKNLTLKNTKITDRGVAAIVLLPNLESFSFTGDGVALEAFEQLGASKSLRSVSVPAESRLRPKSWPRNPQEVAERVASARQRPVLGDAAAIGGRRSGSPGSG